MEAQSVKEVYEEIADHFSETRYSQWNCVRNFLDTCCVGDLIGDIGCGNGKNMLYRNDLQYIGCDISERLVNIARNKTGNEIICSSGTNLPFQNGLFDACMSVAVIHHLSTANERKRFLEEMVRCTKPGGRIMFTVWMLDQPLKTKWIARGNGDYSIPWHNKSGAILQRFYHLFTEEEIYNILPSNCIVEKIVTECYNYVVILRKNLY